MTGVAKTKTVSIIADRYIVSSMGLEGLSPVDRAHIIWTLETWAKAEMQKLFPLLSDDYKSTPRMEKAIAKLDKVIAEADELETNIATISKEPV